MEDKQVTLLNPPITKSPDGNGPRRAGIEIEFSGLTIEAVAGAVKKALGGRAEALEDHFYQISKSAIGTVEIMLDARVAHIGSNESPVERFKKKSGEMIGHVVKPVTPIEIITEPLPYPDLVHLERLGGTLQEAGAKGTDASLLFGFGIHLNPEAGSLKTEHLVNVMKAFALLNPALRALEQVDPTRDLLRWVRPWSDAYLTVLLDPTYQPGRSKMVGDYLELAGNRNADLDMLPLFAHLDEAAVNASITDTLVKARPAYHFRMPNTIFDANSSLIAKHWNRWVTVERLAEETDELEQLCRAAIASAEFSRPLPEVTRFLERTLDQ